MRIWLIQRSEPTPHDNDGKQRLMMMGILSNQLSKKGHEVVWWTSTFDHYNRKHRFKEDQEVSVNDKYLIKYLKGCGYKKNVSLSRIIDNNLVAKKFKIKAKRILHKPDIIFSSIPTAELSLEAVRFGKKNNIPVVLDIRDMWPDVFFDILPDICRKIYPLLSFFIERKLKKACSQADHIVGITDDYVDWGIKHSGRTREILDKEFYLGYIPSKSDNRDINKGFKYWSHYGLYKDSDDLVVSYFGVLGKVYDFNPIIEAAEILQKKKVRKIKFVICGTGENLEYLKEKTKNLKNFFLPGWVYKDEIASLLILSSIGIAPYMPISSYLQTISNKAAEYLSGELPIALSLDKGTLYELLRKNNAGIFYSGSGTVLAENLSFVKK